MDNINSTVRTGPGRPRTYSQEQIDRALELIRSGQTMTAASKTTGLTVERIAYYKRKAGLTGASVPGAMPTVTTDPLTGWETGLLRKYDTEILQLESTIEKATERLKATLSKRKRVERALSVGAIVAEEKTEESKTDVAADMAALGAEAFHTISVGDSTAK